MCGATSNISPKYEAIGITGVKSKLGVKQCRRRTPCMVDSPQHSCTKSDQLQLLNCCMRLKDGKHYAISALTTQSHGRMVVRDDVTQHNECCAQNFDPAQMGEDRSKHSRHTALANESRNMCWLPRYVHQEIQGRQ